MTERGRTRIDCSADHFSVGPSALVWDGNSLRIDISEISAPIPRRVRGVIQVEPEYLNQQAFALDGSQRHFWRPIAPAARVSVKMEAPDLRWSGGGYFDTNHGSEPLEAAFRYWTWSRASLPDGAAIIYDADRRADGPLSLALRFDKSGRMERLDPPPIAPLSRTKWLMPRETRADDGRSSVIRTLEDTPFYSRSEIASRLFGEDVRSVHESLSLDRLVNPIVKLMLPFRMPRRAS